MKRLLIALALLAPIANADDFDKKPAAPRTCNSSARGKAYFDTTTSIPYVCDGTSWVSMTQGVLDPSRHIELMAEYLGCATNSCQIEPWFNNTTGTAASCQVPNGGLLGTNDYGLLQCDTGTTATGRGMAVGSTDMFTMGAGVTTFETRVYLDDLSDDTEDFTFFAGFSDSVGSTFGVDTVAFRYSDDELAGNWVGFTRSNSTETTCDTTVAVTADAWHKLKLVVNAAGTSVGFYVGGTLRCTITTNIPTTTARSTGIVPVQILKTLGNTQRNVYVDYTYIRVDLATAR